MPDLEDIYWDGRDSWRAKIDLENNPHPEDSEESGAWHRGWVDAFEADRDAPENEE